MPNSSYLYDYLASFKPSEGWILERETIRTLGLDPDVLIVSYTTTANSIEKQPYCLLKFKTRRGMQLSHGVDSRLPIDSHIINPKGLVTVFDYHISIYKEPHNINTNHKEYISDIHLTLEYDQTYRTGSIIKKCTAHLYYEVKLCSPGVNFILQKTTVTVNDSCGAKDGMLDKHTTKQCLDIMETYAAPIINAQNVWFQEFESRLYEEGRKLIETRSRLQDLLLTQIYQRVESIPLHPSQRDAIAGKYQLLPITDQQKIIENCTEELHSNIESLLRGNIAARLNLENLKEDLSSSVPRLQNVQKYQLDIVDKLQSMIQLIDLYEFNDLRAIADLSDTKRDAFIKFLTDSFFSGSQLNILSFRTILKRDRVIESLQSFADSLGSDTSVNCIMPCSEVCEQLKKVDQYYVIKETAEKLSNLLSEDASITTDQLVDLQKDINVMCEYYKKFRKVISKFYQANSAKKNEIVTVNYSLIKNGAFLMADFSADQNEDKLRAAAEKFSMLFAEGPPGVEKITANLIKAYQNQSFGGLQELLSTLEKKLQKHNSVGIKDTRLTDSPPLLWSESSSSKPAGSIESRLPSISLNPEAKIFYPSKK